MAPLLFLGLLVCVVGVATLMVWLESRQALRRRRRFQARPVLAVEEWLATFVLPRDLDPDAAIAVCGALAAALRCHVTQVLPEDGGGHGGVLDPVGSFGLWGDDELDEFIESGLPAATGRPLPSDAAWQALNLKTVEDVIRWAHRVRRESVECELPN